jgi:hypothetical protein
MRLKLKSETAIRRHAVGCGVESTKRWAVGVRIARLSSKQGVDFPIDRDASLAGEPREVARARCIELDVSAYSKLILY